MNSSINSCLSLLIFLGVASFRHKDDGLLCRKPEDAKEANHYHIIYTEDRLLDCRKSGAQRLITAPSEHGPEGREIRSFVVLNSRNYTGNYLLEREKQFLM